MGIKWHFMGDSPTYLIDQRLCLVGGGSPHKQSLWTMSNANLIYVLRKLGFQINHNKVEGPTTTLKFPGIQLDAQAMTTVLSDDKLLEMKSSWPMYIHWESFQKRLSKSVITKLNRATQVTYGGNFHLRRLIDRVAALKKPPHRTRITADMLADLEWWIQFLDQFNGTMPMVDHRPSVSVATNACNTAAGSFFQGAWIYTPWQQC